MFGGYRHSDKMNSRGRTRRTGEDDETEGAGMDDGMGVGG